MHVPALRADWVSQAFVHWAYSPDQVQRLLPESLVVDTYEGSAWVSLTTFVMAGVRPPGFPAALPAFLETNLRTYVRGRDGRDGLWFLSIEVGCPVMLAARALGFPYHQGRLGSSRRRGVLTYTGARWGRGPGYRLAVRPDAQVTPTRRDVWLTSRWRVFTRSCGALWETPVEHAPWPLREAGVEAVEESLTRTVGLPPPSAEPLAHFSDGVHKVRLGISRPVRPSRVSPAGDGARPW
ncbi:YqjF family protein [Streptomyces sp. NPDC004561]